MSRVYLYGVVECEGEAALAVPGRAADSPVRVLAGRGLGALVSDYRGDELGALPRESLLRLLLDQQRALERAMEDYLVLPVKFGTILNGREEALEILRQGRCQLLSALNQVRGKAEIEVAATWEVERVLQEVAREGALVQAREAVAAEGHPGMEERVGLGRLVKEVMDRRRESYRERMMGCLQPLAEDALPNALLAEAMVLNVAFLVERAREREFDAGVQQLDGLFGGEIAFRVIGPLPPYSFSSVEATLLKAEQAEEARGALGLSESFGPGEVRQAYRRQAARMQSEASEAGYARLKQASDLLQSYCRSEGQASGNHSAHSDRWAIAIRRAGGEEIAASRFQPLG